MSLFIKPTGNVIKGHILDCAVKPLVRKMKDLDSRLYVKWNPRKLSRWGCWEVRRLPEEKVVKEIVTYQGVNYLVIDHLEDNFANHIIDVPFLNYELITKLKAMDTWSHGAQGANFLAQMDSNAKSHEEAVKEKAKQERNYELKQHKSQIRELMDYTLSGNDPSQIANYWPK